jgi:polyribonucleotide nucleotidyltransferase
VDKVTDIMHEGDKVWVRCMGADNRGKIRLSMRNIDQKTGEDVEWPEDDRKDRKKKGKGKPEAESKQETKEPVLEQTGEDLASIFGDK